MMNVHKDDNPVLSYLYPKAKKIEKNLNEFDNDQKISMLRESFLKENRIL